MKASFFAYQHKRLGILLAWGAGSVVTGAIASLSSTPYRRQFGLQAAVWGGIDAAIAVLGRRGAKAAADRLDRGEISEDEVASASEGFGRILALNAGLDVLYVLGGIWLARSVKRRGMGAGIALQGLFLFVYDSILALEVRRSI